MVVLAGVLACWAGAGYAGPADAVAEPAEARAATKRRFPQLEWRRVTGAAEEVLAGSLSVPENRTTRTGRTIALNVVVVPALDPTDVREPLFELAGGPGVAATGAAGLYLTELSDYRRNRDIVLVDQRGTGASNSLAAEPDPAPQAHLREMYPVEYVQALRRRLEERADLTQYTTAIAMDDLDDVRAWLGYQKINLFGFSYGTRAALVYLRQHEKRVRCAMLMGVSPPFHRLPLHHARDGQRALDLLLEECAADPVAGRAFPRLREELQELLARLGGTPAEVSFHSSDGPPPVKLTITRDVFAEEIRSMLYAPATSRRIPLIIHRAARGDFGPFLRSALPVDRGAPEAVADGMYLSVTTAEDTPFIDSEEAETLATGTMFGNYRVVQQVRASRLWPQGELPKGYRDPVRSAVPVLIISGRMDPVTPPEWGDRVAVHLPNSRHVVLPHGAHVPDGLANIERLDRLLMEFLERGGVEALDTEGLETLQPPPFETETRPP